MAAAEIYCFLLIRQQVKQWRRDFTSSRTLSSLRDGLRAGLNVMDFAEIALQELALS
ncbi:MAG TPA: hypothetical protein PKM87_05590 [Methanolinea sp.]|nr:MAG: hypothetical protein A4E41_01283 [Methanoregulaceae archaeon PtaU1.Bin066]HNQ29576.1 hypothetical protein [Methanolinea sp.]